MKLETLEIDEYRVLRNLKLHFERDIANPNALKLRDRYALDFLAGVNGTGKTTALQFLARLFVHLYESDHFAEPFQLTYQIDSGGDASKPITVTNRPASQPEEEQASPKVERQFRYQVGESAFVTGKLPSEHLPRYLVVYTTGSEAEWQQILTPEDGNSEPTEVEVQGKISVGAELPGHQPDMRSYRDDNDSDPPDRKILFIRAEHLPLVTLCGILASRWNPTNGKETLTSVLEDIRLQELPAFSLRIRAYDNLTEQYQMEIIKPLEQVADQVINSGGDKLLLFEMSSQLCKRKEPEPKSIFTLYPTPIDLFRALHLLYEHRPFYDAPLQEVNLFFHRHQEEKVKESSHVDVRAEQASDTTDAPMLLLYDWMSDGERSFLARMALFALFQADNLLILLDEPEVHFNDVWKREIVQKLDQIMSGHSSHALITTHSSIALSDVPSDDVLVLRRNGRYTTGEEHSPGITTFGADPSDILVHVFGTLSPNGERSRSFIREEIGKRRSAKELTDLSDMVAPGYWRYRIQLEAQSVQGKLQ